MKKIWPMTCHYLHINTSQKLRNICTLSKFSLQQRKQRTCKHTATNTADINISYPTAILTLWHTMNGLAWLMPWQLFRLAAIYGTNVLSHMLLKQTSINTFNAVLNIIPSLQYNASTRSLQATCMPTLLLQPEKQETFWAQKPTTSRTSYLPNCVLNISVYILMLDM